MSERGEGQSGKVELRRAEGVVSQGHGQRRADVKVSDSTERKREFMNGG